MATYTVKAGDTLSGIAKSLGLPSYSSLTGYKSGNPNLIRPGEVLTYGAATPTPAPTPASNSAGALEAFANAQRAESAALLSRQNKEQEGLFANYESIRKGQEALPALYERLKKESGIPELSNQAQIFKNEIYKTKDTIDRLAEDVLARTTGTLTTEAQRRRLQAAEEEPLQTNLSRLGTGLAPIADMLSSAQQGLSTQLELNTQQQDRDLEPIKLRINAISDKFARELTGFTADRELQLTALVDKITRERELSDRDWQLAQTLAAEERAFARQKASAAAAFGYSGGGGAYGGGGPAPAKITTRNIDDIVLPSPLTIGTARSGSLGPSKVSLNTGSNVVPWATPSNGNLLTVGTAKSGNLTVRR